MDIVERLLELSTEERRKHKSPPDLVMFDAADEIKRLRQQHAELLVEMNRIADVSERWEDCFVSQINEIARAAITKAKGSE